MGGYKYKEKELKDLKTLLNRKRTKDSSHLTGKCFMLAKDICYFKVNDVIDISGNSVEIDCTWIDSSNNEIELKYDTEMSFPIDTINNDFMQISEEQFTQFIIDQLEKHKKKILNV